MKRSNLSWNSNNHYLRKYKKEVLNHDLIRAFLFKGFFDFFYYNWSLNVYFFSNLCLCILYIVSVSININEKDDVCLKALGFLWIINISYCIKKRYISFSLYFDKVIYKIRIF